MWDKKQASMYRSAFNDLDYSNEYKKWELIGFYGPNSEEQSRKYYW